MIEPDARNERRRRLDGRELSSGLTTELLTALVTGLVTRLVTGLVTGLEFRPCYGLVIDPGRIDHRTLPRVLAKINWGGVANRARPFEPALNVLSKGFLSPR